ncbi:dihydrolipoyl dehydrogenase [Bradymonas sediminis]|uniref:Dihydrolipoyl dehydrogenase n=1 Tax=Bradymonas sediminis TaxID=1548548 RepID=A0A2Z4FHA5_9DELT|nr:dihydrolipoyl dehydrogenase [Bradymonas sediminis]AWV88289.1 dihydrolipoyl dehydrogenase [Bradymonas sediminis]TDP77412.1 dihydrolipoamide dehydrogenase [Bradymonas sediminis]
MKTRQVDIAIIGAGTAGLNASREAHRAGKSWVIIDPGPYGTTCARVGCMPSKLLIAAAERAHTIAGAAEFGIQVNDWKVDGPAVLKRVRSERDRFAGFVKETVESFDPENLIRARARFSGPNTLIVDAKDDTIEVKAKAIVIATGSSPWTPPQLEGVADDVLTSDEIFEMEDLPASMAVFGTGIIGVEIGQAFAQLGVAIEFFNPFEDIGRFSDPKVVAETHRSFDEQLTMHLKSDVSAVEKVDGGFRIEWTDRDGEAHTRTFEAILNATGRRANVSDLDLEKTGIPLNEHGLPISSPRTLQCGDAPIFIAGDVSGHRPLLHEASDEGRIAGANALRFPDVQAYIRKTTLEIAFTSPQMAIVGNRWADLDHDEVVSGEVSFANQGRSRVMGVNEGLVRLYATKQDCRLVGAEMFGPRMEHMAHLLAWAIQQNTTVPELIAMPVYHPVFEEGLRTGLRDLAKSLRIAGHCQPQDRGEGPGV